MRSKICQTDVFGRYIEFVNKGKILELTSNYIKIIDVVSEVRRELVCYSFSIGQYITSLQIIVVGKPITKQTHHEYYNENVTLAHIMLTTLFRSPNLTCQSCKHCSLVQTCLLCFVIMVLLTRILYQNKYYSFYFYVNHQTHIEIFSNKLK